MGLGALGVAVLCKRPPVVLDVVEANGWWVWSSHPRAAYMDHAKRRVLHLLYTMRDAAFDCDDPEAVVLIQGESSSSSKGELAKAILEGIAFRMSEIVELSVQSLGLESNSVLPIDGGLSRSDAFCQIQADLLGRPLVRHSIVEATVYGAAVAGGQGIGSDICGSSNQGDIFEPIFTRDEADEKLSKWQKQVLPDK